MRGKKTVSWISPHSNCRDLIVIIVINVVVVVVYMGITWGVYGMGIYGYGYGVYGGIYIRQGYGVQGEDTHHHTQKNKMVQTRSQARHQEDQEEANRLWEHEVAMEMEEYTGYGIAQIGFDTIRVVDLDRLEEEIMGYKINLRC